MDTKNRKELRRVFNVLQIMNPGIKEIAFDYYGDIYASMTVNMLSKLPHCDTWTDADIRIAKGTIKTSFKHIVWWSESLTVEPVRMVEGKMYSVVRGKDSYVGTVFIGQFCGINITTGGPRMEDVSLLTDCVIRELVVKG